MSIFDRNWPSSGHGILAVKFTYKKFMIMIMFTR